MLPSPPPKKTKKQPTLPQYYVTCCCCRSLMQENLSYKYCQTNKKMTYANKKQPHIFARLIGNSKMGI